MNVNLKVPWLNFDEIESDQVSITIGDEALVIDLIPTRPPVSPPSPTHRLVHRDMRTGVFREMGRAWKHTVEAPLLGLRLRVIVDLFSAEPTLRRAYLMVKIPGSELYSLHRIYGTARSI